MIILPSNKRQLVDDYLKTLIYSIECQIIQSEADLEAKYVYPLQSGSLLYMSQQVQDEWKHAILRQAEVGGRISLTFRQLKQP